MNLVAFYAAKAADYQGRRLEDILAWEDDDLEDVHDFIQVLFPLRARSGVNPDAPLLTDEVVAAFHRDANLRANLVRAFERMLKFYGFKRSPGRIERAPNFDERSKVWLRKGNHNHLRITRILSSLSILGLQAESAEFLAALMEIRQSFPERITGDTAAFWQGAVAAR